MLKGKLHFKEDNKHLKLVKEQNNNSKDIKYGSNNFMKAYPARGRQLNIRTADLSISNKKNTFSKGSHTTTSHSRSGKVIVKHQKKISQKFSKIKRDSSFIDGECESSDSDYSLRKYKLKELLTGSKNSKENKKSNKDINLNHTDSKELADYLIYNFEETLRNEIEKILIDIYNHHISLTSKKQKMDLTKYEKQIAYFSQALNKEFDVCILNILVDKIKELITEYKEKIFEIPEIKRIRDRYYKYKNSVLKPQSQLHHKMNSNRDNKEAKLINYHKGISKMNKANKENIDLNESDNSIIKILLLELRNIKKSLIESSKNIEKVFHVPLLNILLNNKTLKFSFEEMHREEFAEIIVNDEFISVLMIQIKAISEGLKIEEVNLLICHIEEDVYSSKKEMTRFIKFLSQVNIGSDNECENSSNEYADSKNHSPQQHYLDVYTISDKDTSIKLSKNSSSSPSEKVKFSDDIGIEELVEYIEKSDKKKKKKNRKRNKKKQISDTISIQISNNNQVEEHDEEVELFKKSLKESTSSERKIKPLISKEWLSKLVNNTIKV